MKFELTKEERDILYTFLNRVNLTGQEVQAFNQLTNIFSNPIEEKKDKK